MSLRATLYWPFFIFLLFFVGFRFEVGCDWGGYLRNYYFPVIDNFRDTLTTLDPGYWALLLMLREIDAPYQMLNVVTGGIFFLGLHFFARRQPNQLAFIALCFPVLIVNMPMSGIRQGAAIGFMCLAYVAFIDRKVFMYVLWILLGSTFHSSILVFLVLTPFITGEPTKRRILFSSIIALPLVWLLSQSGAAELASTRYIENSVTANGAIFRLSFLFITGMIFILKLAPNWRNKHSADYPLAFVGALMMIVSVAGLPISTVISDRFGYYLVPIQAMIFARIPYLSLSKNSPMISAVPYVALILFFVVWSQFSWHFKVCYVPYKINFL